MRWRKYRREIGGDKPLPLDREQNGGRAAGFAWQKPPRRSTIWPLMDLATDATARFPSPTSSSETDSMAALGRLGQFLGLAIPAVAILLELNHAISLGQMLVMLVAAICCFWIGRIVEGYFRNV